MQSKIVVDEDPLIINIIRSKDMTTNEHVGDAIKFVEEVSSIAVETQPVQVPHTLVHDSDIDEKHNGDQQNNPLLDMHITGPWCDVM